MTLISSDDGVISSTTILILGSGLCHCVSPLPLLSTLQMMKNLPNKFHLLHPARHFVKRSVMFSNVFTYAVLQGSLVEPLRTWCYAMEFNFFFKVDDGTEVLQSTYFLSLKTNVGLTTGIPTILSLQHKSCTYVVACFMVTNSLPNVMVSHAVHFFDNQ